MNVKQTAVLQIKNAARMKHQVCSLSATNIDCSDKTPRDREVFEFAATHSTPLVKLQPNEADHKNKCCIIKL